MMTGPALGDAQAFVGPLWRSCSFAQLRRRRVDRISRVGLQDCSMNGSARRVTESPRVGGRAMLAQSDGEPEGGCNWRRGGGFEPLAWWADRNRIGCLPSNLR